MPRVSAREAKEWARDTMRGFFTSPMIPFDDKLAMDEGAVARNVDTLLGIGVSGIGFGFSEPWHLSRAERLHSIDVFVEAVAGRAACYVHATDHSAPETIGLIRRAQDAGADAVMVWAPYEFAKSQESACEWFEYIAGETDIPFILYNTYHSGIKLSPESIERISRLPAVCAVKNGVNEFTHTVAVAERVGDRVVVSEPLEEHLPAAIQYLDQQVLLGTTSVYLMQTPAYQPIREYAELFWAGRRTEGWQAYHGLEPLREIWRDTYRVLWDTRHATHPVALIKMWMDIIGMHGGPVRPPTPSLPEHAERYLRERLMTSGWLERLCPPSAGAAG
ncbi:putative 5-dehydro-4-deoxyglucarate dehydratase [Actinomadura sp. NBRC 104412]|uniref:dihydrodipicolinate synthase family protein n=1 Tax=Actinomadura sp. NBRC 104412 TaxID=3032203 RepID=UPI0024A43B5A|nr:dihydrodipicolinate synthase family protein [Actinomadura sp. NBRC 104412]GLZ07500.1 putative 5-dehydro-4-deoxyglucarate dehydratase [Actinomadura sp. NBRC 104412]